MRYITRNFVDKFTKIIILLVMIAYCNAPLFAAEHLDCVNTPMGEAEQILLKRHHDNLRGDDEILSIVQTSLESRAQVCAYLNRWSRNATRLAFEHIWLQTQWGLVPSAFSNPEEVRLEAALGPMRPRLNLLLAPAASAIAHGKEPPPPSSDGSMFKEFNGLLKAAKIPQNSSTENLLHGWLYMKGFQAALIEAFSKE